MSDALRRLASGAINRAWDWVRTAAVVSPDTTVGRRFRSMGPSSSIAFPPGDVFGERWITIGSGTMIGPHVSMAVGMPGEPIDPNADPVVSIGDRCSIGRGSSIIGRRRIVIENDVTLAPNVYVTDQNHTYADVSMPIGQQWLTEDAVRIGAGSWIGCGVVVLPGADIGRHVTVAAGSVVRGVIPDHTVIAGSPAKVVRRYVDERGWEPPLRQIAGS